MNRNLALAMAIAALPSAAFTESLRLSDLEMDRVAAGTLPSITLPPLPVDQSGTVRLGPVTIAPNGNVVTGTGVVIQVPPTQ